MSATDSMNVLLTGKTLPGADIDRAAAAFAKMAGIPPDQARAVITSGKARTVKQCVPPETALALARRFAGLGIEAVAKPAATPQAAKPAPAAFCTNCGNAVAEQAAACPQCGFHPRRERKFCFNCGTAIDARQVMCVKCGVSLKGAVLDALASMAGGATRKAAEFIGRHMDNAGARSTKPGGSSAPHGAGPSPKGGRQFKTKDLTTLQKALQMAVMKSWQLDEFIAEEGMITVTTRNGKRFQAPAAALTVRWAKDEYGRKMFHLSAGGEKQRFMAIPWMLSDEEWDEIEAILSQCGDYGEGGLNKITNLLKSGTKIFDKLD